MKQSNDYSCGSIDHLTRRSLLKAAGFAGLAWLTPLARVLARAEEKDRTGKPAKSVIILWMAGAPSQLETFDPHPNSKIAFGTKAINTAVPGIQLAEGFEQLAELMPDITLIRSVTTKEGDHERASYNMKTGYRPTPAITHPSLGAIICHELEDSEIEIPRHISIAPGRWPARGGFLGAEYDAFQIYDPKNNIPDLSPRVDESRQHQRIKNLSVVEEAFAKGRIENLDENKTLHQSMINQALKMMSSDQLKAFDVSLARKGEREAFGDTPFGRGCLAAARLVEAGVRCIEITLKGWDTHANNHEIQSEKVKILDPAFTALIRYLKERGLLDRTVVLCGGEFGRTPRLNSLEGRDHWPHGFSMAVAGGGIRGGHVIGQTDPTGKKKEPIDPVRVQDIHATVQHVLGIDYEKEIETPIGRPIALSDGRVIRELLG